jgi:hypothetical protein
MSKNISLAANFKTQEGGYLPFKLYIPPMGPTQPLPSVIPNIPIYNRNLISQPVGSVIFGPDKKRLLNVGMPQFRSYNNNYSNYNNYNNNYSNYYNYDHFGNNNMETITIKTPTETITMTVPYQHYQSVINNLNRIVKYHNISNPWQTSNYNNPYMISSSNGNKFSLIPNFPMLSRWIVKTRDMFGNKVKIISTADDLFNRVQVSYK